MKWTLRAGVTALTIVAGLGVFASGANAATYKVTVYNLTEGQIFNPTFVAAHSRGVSIFEPGVVASIGLAELAEDAKPDVLKDELEAAGATVVVGDPIMPGAHGSVYIETSRRNRRISVVGMLVTTNDAFYGLNGVRAGGRSNSYYVPAYDAGSEKNDEDCENIPGPPCGDTGADGTDEDGVVHIHNGIHGLMIASPPEDGVVPATHDWRNPVAKITVVRVHKRRSKNDDDNDDDDDDD